MAAFSLSAVGSVSYYMGVSYVPTYLQSVAGVGALDALTWATVAGFLLLVITPLAGLASDRWGRRPLLLGIAALLVAGSVPLFALLSAGSTAGILVGAVGLALLAGAWSAVAASASPEHFPTAERFSGIAVGYNLATALFGGFVPLTATALVAWTGVAVSPAFVLVLVSLAVLPLIWFGPETSATPLSTPADGSAERSADPENLQEDNTSGTPTQSRGRGR